MSTTTTNFGLVIPGDGDFQDREDFETTFNAIDTTLKDHQDDIARIDGYFRESWDTTANGGLTAATNWTLTNGRTFQFGPLVAVYGVLTRAGSALTVDSLGDVPNTDAFNVPVALPVSAFHSHFGSGSTGRMASFFMSTGGVGVLTAVSPGANIAIGDQLSFGGFYITSAAF